jgi:hypothetical protein
LIGLLIGSFLGGVLAPAVTAVEYNYQLDNLEYYLHKIAGNVDTIETYVKRIYRDMD